MAKFAELIGKDGSSYAKKAEELKLLINHKYFDTSKAIYANGSQAAQGVALYLESFLKNTNSRLQIIFLR